MPRFCCAFSRSTDVRNDLTLKSFLQNTHSMSTQSFNARFAAAGIVEALRGMTIERQSDSALLVAASNGQLEIVKNLLLSTPGQKSTNASIAAAAENGHFLIVELLHNYRTERCTGEAVRRARTNGHTSIVEYLLKHDECRLADKKFNGARRRLNRIRNRRKSTRRRAAIGRSRSTTSSGFGSFGSSAVASPFGGVFGGGSLPGVFGLPTPLTSTVFGSTAGVFGSSAAKSPFEAISTTTTWGFGPKTGFRGFGSQPPLSASAHIGTGQPLYQPTRETEPGVSGAVNFVSISCMPAYASKSTEELRYEDYTKPKKPVAAFGDEEKACIQAEEIAKLRADEERIRSEVQLQICAERVAIRREERETIRSQAETRIRREEEARFRAEEEARLRVKEEARIRVDNEAIRAKIQEEARLKIRAKIRAEEEAKLRDRIRKAIGPQVEAQLRAKLRAEIRATATIETPAAAAVPSCSICQGSMMNPMTTSCQHTFCTACLQQWLRQKHTCPICRSAL